MQDYSSLHSSEPILTMVKSPTLWDILSTTALSRCWPVLICSAIWSSVICALNHYTHGKLSTQPTLITVFGTVLGFVISFRTTSSIERYNDGRRFWSQIMLHCRIFARTVWFHVPDTSSSAPSVSHPMSNEEREQDQAKVLIEKKTVVNLLEAYAVAVKHYLRGEDGIRYKDLYPLVSFLPSYYSLPAIIPSLDPPELHRRATHASTHSRRDIPTSPVSKTQEHEFQIPLPPIPETSVGTAHVPFPSESTLCDEESILPASIPPKHSWQAAFPFSFFLWIWRIMKNDVRKAVGVVGAGRDFRPNENNVPLEISLFLSSYISALQVRKTADVPTINLLYLSLNQLVDALTGLERILTTPIPVSYSSHLWMVTLVYCTTLPFQLWSTLAWFSVPASVIASFIFFGFVVAGEEIENPFGYDRNDLNMDHFVQSMRKELHALTARPAPDPTEWAFSPRNNFLGIPSKVTAQNETPTDWLRKGKAEILEALRGINDSTEVVG